MPRSVVALAVGLALGFLAAQLLAGFRGSDDSADFAPAPTAQPEPTPTPALVAPAPTRCRDGVWALPVRDEYDRVTATFGVKGTNSGYFRAMQAVGALREGAQAVFHTGVDFGVRMFSPVLAVADGEVVSYAYLPSLGHHLILRVDQPAGVEVVYAHLHSAFYHPGERVRCGEVIAVSGASGRAVAGAHLHFEVRWRGEPIDPAPFLDAARRARQVSAP